MRTCPTCGRQLESDWSLCPDCWGAKPNDEGTPNYRRLADMPSENPGFWSAIATCFRKYAVFEGRATRLEFWRWIAFIFLFYLVQTLLAAPIGYVGRMVFRFAWLGAAGAPPFLTLVFALPTIAVVVRRLHDMNRSGVSGGIFLVCCVATQLLALPASFISWFILGDNPPRELEWIYRAAVPIVCGAAHLVLLIFAVVVMSRPGTPGDNQYGPDPRRRKPAAVGKGTTNEDV